jgi:surface antigen
MNGMGGHVAIVAQSNGNGTIRVLNANVASNGGSKGTSIMSNLSTGSLLGYLRPKKLM